MRGKKARQGRRGLRTVLVFTLIAALALGPAGAAAKVFLGGEPPREDWYRRPLMRLTVFAAGQSDCMLLEAGGQAMMIDGGSEPFRDDLKNAIQARGITHFKYLLNTHFHDDHISGLYWLMRFGFKADEYLHPYNDYALNVSQRHAKTLAQAERSGIPIRQVFAGDELLLGEAVLTVYRYEDGLSTNGKSLLTRIVFGDASILLTADIIGDTQTYFVKNLPKETLKADILKAPHHGITPMVVKFLETIAPEVLVMTNYRSRVDKGAVQADARGIPTYYAANGTVVLETDGDDWYVRQLDKVF